MPDPHLGVDIRTSRPSVQSRMEALALRLTGTAAASFDAPSSLWYLGAGYWRAAYDDSTMYLHLVNPSVPSPHIRIVEQALNILTW